MSDMVGTEENCDKVVPVVEVMGSAVRKIICRYQGNGNGSNCECEMQKQC